MPSGSPHRVENMKNSLAISSNFVNSSNYELVKEELRINELQDPRAGELLRSLQAKEFRTL